MAKTIRIDDDVYEGLKELAEPFEDDPNSVIKRLLFKNDFSLKIESSQNSKSKQADDRGEKNFDLESGAPAKNLLFKIEEEGFENSEEIIENNSADVKVSYEFSRLCFIAKHIDLLDDDDIFQVVTKRDGVFRFSKSDFYKNFPNVVASKSYQQNGIYHYPKVPEKAKAFQVRI